MSSHWNKNKKRRRPGFFLSPSKVAITTMAAGVGGEGGGGWSNKQKVRPSLCHPNPSRRHLLTAPTKTLSYSLFKRNTSEVKLHGYRIGRRRRSRCPPRRAWRRSRTGSTTRRSSSFRTSGTIFLYPFLRHWPFNYNINLSSLKISRQGVTKWCRLSWQTNSALVYEPKCGGGGRPVAGSQPMSTVVHRSPNKLWRYNSIFNLCLQVLWKRLKTYSAEGVASFFRPGFTNFRFVGVYLRINFFVFMNQCLEHCWASEKK